MEYIQNDNSRASLLMSFRKNYSDTMVELEKGGRRIDFLEQYDPDDDDPKTAVSQPYAFVCDRVAMIAGGSNAEYYSSKLMQNKQAKSGRQVKERAKTQPMSLAAPYNSPANITALSANMENVIAEGFRVQHRTVGGAGRFERQASRRRKDWMVVCLQWRSREVI